MGRMSKFQTQGLSTTHDTIPKTASESGSGGRDWAELNKQKLVMKSDFHPREEEAIPWEDIVAILDQVKGKNMVEKDGEQNGYKRNDTKTI